MTEIDGREFFCSWSGGKDSSLAYYYTLQEGGVPAGLVTTMLESGDRTRAHGLSREILRQQADRLNTDLFTCPTSWDDYEDNFIELLDELQQKNGELELGVFGDIDLEGHREWVEKVCGEVGLTAYLPLWEKSRRELICEFVDTDFEAIIVALDAEVLSEEYLGRPLDMAFIAELERLELDPSGENGEYHTVVVDGPIFSEPLSYELGEITSRDGKLFQEIISTAGGS